MHIAKKEDSIEIYWIKITIYSLILVFCIVMVILAPKKIFDAERPFQIATSMAILSDDNLIMYDYKAYSTEVRFQTGLIYDVEERKQEFKDRNEIMVIKIYGETTRYEIKDDHVLIESPDVPELNIEYFLAQNLMIDGTSVPCRTFIMLFQDFSKLINNVYLAVLSITSISIIAPLSIKLSRRVLYIIKRNNQPQQND